MGEIINKGEMAHFWKRENCFVKKVYKKSFIKKVIKQDYFQNLKKCYSEIGKGRGTIYEQ